MQHSYITDLHRVTIKKHSPLIFNSYRQLAGYKCHYYGIILKMFILKHTILTAKLNITIFLALLFVGYFNVHYSQEEWKLFNTSNSGIAEDFVEDVIIDDKGVVWIAGHYNLSRYDGKEWSSYYIAISINDLELMNNGDILIATNFGLFVFNTNTFEVTDFNNTNLPFEDIECVAIDQNDNIWIGHSIGNHRIAFYDGTNWTEHTPNIYSNAASVYSIDCFENHVWAGIGSDLFHFDGQSWERFDELNSPIPDQTLVYDVKCDINGKVWMGTSRGRLSDNSGRLLSFDLSNWTSLDSNDCIGIWNGVSSIAFLDSNYWFASYWNGFVYYDHSNFKIYDHTSSIFPSKYNTVVAADQNRNVYMGNFGGLIVYNEDGINIDGHKYEKMFCYPVPTRNEANLLFYIQNSGIVDISIYNMNGLCVAQYSKYFKKGRNTFNVDLSGISSGAYIARFIKDDNSGSCKIIKVD